MNIRIIG